MTAGGLTGRLKMVADMVTPGMIVYDIGCDHGFLDIHLVGNGTAPKAVAADINKGPLKAADKNIASAGLSDLIQTVISDGLCAVEAPSAPSALVMAGMGGPLILKILEDDPVKTRAFSEIIISPQSRIGDVRKGIRRMDFVILDEACTYDQNKYYVAMKLTARDTRHSHVTEEEKAVYEALGDRARRICDRYGAKLIASSDPALMRYLEWEEGILKRNAAKVKLSENIQAYNRVTEDIEDNRMTHKLMEG